MTGKITRKRCKTGGYELPDGCRWCRDYPNSAHNPRDSGNQFAVFGFINGNFRL